MRIVDPDLLESLPPGTLYAAHTPPPHPALSDEWGEFGPLLMEADDRSATAMIPRFVSACGGMDQKDIIATVEGGGRAPERDHDHAVTVDAAPRGARLAVLEPRDVEALIAKLGRCRAMQRSGGIEERLAANMERRAIDGAFRPLFPAEAAVVGDLQDGRGGAEGDRMTVAGVGSRARGERCG